MSYQVLARKWRPKNFSELVGQAHVVRALVNALEQNRLHHAYLLSGTRGIGKTTIARIMAKALNCEQGVSSRPCNVCPACLDIDAGRFIDLLELDAASNTQVENMRELLDSAQYAPSSGRYKVYIIDEVHMLSKSAFNAMLKTLEEPPPHVKFILATTDTQKIPITVLSRCLQFNLKQMTAADIADHLRVILSAENIAAEEPAMHLLAQAAAGSMRDALSLLDQAIAYSDGKVAEAGVREMLGAIDQRYLFSLLAALLSSDGAALMKHITQMAERSLSFERALQDLAALLHRITLAQVVPSADHDNIWDAQQVRHFAASFPPETIQLYYQIALLGRRDLELAPDEYAGFSMTLMRMLAFNPVERGVDAAVSHTELPVKPPPSAVSASPEGKLVDVASSEVKRFNGDWLGLLQELKLSGVAKMLAQHCELKEYSETHIELCVPPEQRHFMEKSYQEKLRASIAKYFGGSPRVTFSVGSVNGQSVAQLERQARAKEQQQAVEAIESDPFVRDLVDKLDAEIITIQPVNKGE